MLNHQDTNTNLVPYIIQVHSHPLRIPTVTVDVILLDISSKSMTLIRELQEYIK